MADYLDLAIFEDFRNAQSYAKSQRRGMWHGTFDRPSVWRRKMREHAAPKADSPVLRQEPL